MLDNGIGQGDPLSMALYQYYNADILEIPGKPQESAEACIDNTIPTATAKTFEEAHEILVEMMMRKGGMIEWSKSHNSSIEYSKLALIDFAHPGVKKHCPPLELPGIMIEPMQSTKYLGIVLDQNLKWSQQMASIHGEGSKWTAQIKRLTRPTWGLTPNRVQKLFISVALPCILYRINIWCMPIHGRSVNECRKGSVATIKKLISVQHTGALAVTGGFRTSHTDTLDAHSALLPINLKIEKVCHDTITRIATLPQEHPLHKLIRKSMKRHTKHYRSPMHILTSIFGLDPSKMERIPPVCTHPKKRGLQRVCIDIPPNKDKSKRADTNALEVIRVYLDGSAHDRGVGVAAILKHEGKPDCTLKLHLDTTEQHTVYEAKLAGMIMGLYLIKTEARSKTTCVLNVDNQAALIAIKSEMNKLEQHLVVNTLQIAKQLLDHKGNKNFRLTFRWSAGHVGIQGNEDMDEIAKAAAEGESSDKKNLPLCLRKEIGHSPSTMRQAQNEKLKTRWTKTWAKSPRYTHLQYKDLLTLHSQKYLKYISSGKISRRIASTIFQLRVGHAPLNRYLHRFKKVDSPQCPACGHPKETPEHFLLQCPSYTHERWRIISQRRERPPRLTELLSSTKLLIPLANYIEATERFKINK